MKYLNIKANDLNECAELFTEVFSNSPWNEPWNLSSAKARLEEIFHTPGFLGIKAIEGSSLVAFLMGYTESYHTGKEFYLKEICVQTSVQRTGIGSRLLDKFQMKAIENGVTRIYLLTSPNGLAASFYLKNKYHINPRVILMSHRLIKNSK